MIFEEPGGVGDLKRKNNLLKRPFDSKRRVAREAVILLEVGPIPIPKFNIFEGRSGN